MQKLKIENNFVIERYKNKKRIDSYISKTKKGLNKEEEIIIKKYLTPKQKILVVGCGTGREIYGLKKIGFKNIIGIDISPDMIKEAKKLVPKTKLFVCDINQFRSNQKFDAIIYFNNILEQIPSINKKKNAINKTKELLNPKGLIFLTTHSCFMFKKNILELARNILKYLSYKMKLRKDSPFEYIDLKEKIYASYSNPFLIKKILKRFFKIKEMNSKKFILSRKKPYFIYIFDEPIYYVGELR